MKQFLTKKIVNKKENIQGNCFICGGCWGVCSHNCSGGNTHKD